MSQEKIIRKLKLDRINLFAEFEELFIHTKDHISPFYEKKYGKTIKKYNSILSKESVKRNFKPI